MDEENKSQIYDDTYDFMRDVDIYGALRSLMRGDAISDNALKAIRDLCNYGLGLADQPIDYRMDIITAFKSTHVS